MSKGVNKQTIVGNLAADNELVYVGEKETPKLTCRVIANTGFGEYEHAQGFDVVLWGKRAEGLHPYLTKGTRVYLEGETRTRNWDDDDGQTHYRTEVVISPYGGDIVLLGGNGRQVAEGESAGEEPTGEIPF
jgi:single-strand DNA-binding protein